MPPGHNAITYVQADVRVALTALLILSGGSHTRARNVKGIHACPHLVAFHLSLCSDRWTLCLGSFWINYNNYLWSCVRPVASLICFCVLCFRNKDFMNKKHWEEKKLKKSLKSWFIFYWTYFSIINIINYASKILKSIKGCWNHFHKGEKT